MRTLIDVFLAPYLLWHVYAMLDDWAQVACFEQLI
jgi:hypothetical protein